MSLRKFLTFSALICALFCIYLGYFGLEQEFWQKLFVAVQASSSGQWDNPPEWTLGFRWMGYLLIAFNLALYFLGKNWHRGLYLGIFVLTLLLTVFISSWIITH
tara:strand:+ start:699 stop:1010 length:312 start_codon:yes stop_codon:yes gene_type:complete